ncbi:MAG: DUF3098 domain-containing protein [Bacteroidaceae bacterium]|nr:DUF3098 domain-containing protein [Bacteroidaceae bacterium]
MKRINYIVLIIGIASILLGFFLMSGEGTTEETYCPEIFSDIRIKVAPLVCLLGYLLCGMWIICSDFTASHS